MAKSRPVAPRGGRPARRRLPIPWPILALLLLVVGTALYTALVPRAHAAEHPHPRAGVTAAGVQPPERYAADPRIAQIYEEVSRIPAVADGIYCYCNCSRHAGHYSLLSCFQDDHGAGCDICLDQAHLAYVMTQQGRSLDEIRAAIDERFGG